MIRTEGRLVCGMSGLDLKDDDDCLAALISFFRAGRYLHPSEFMIVEGPIGRGADRTREIRSQEHVRRTGQIPVDCSIGTLKTIKWTAEDENHTAVIA